MMKRKLTAMLLPPPSVLYKQGSYQPTWPIIMMMISVISWRLKSRLSGLNKEP